MGPDSGAVAAIAAAGVFCAGLWALLRPRWMGFSGKTLWDWIALLAVPTVVGFATVLINAGQARIAQDRAEEEALRSYVDRISALALEGHLDGQSAAADAVARAQTLAVLQIVDGPRAGRVLRFLDEIGLAGRMVAELEGFDFAGADLKGLDLSGLDFEGAALAGADLEEADLSGADLEEADLRGADLKGADLSGASLEDALMRGALLDHADLRGADLTGASGLRSRELARACLDAETRLPAGVTVPGWTGCQGEAEED